MVKGSVPLWGKQDMKKTNARRRSMGLASKMLINAVEPEEFRIAVIKEGRLDGFLHRNHRDGTEDRKIFIKALWSEIEPSLQACFVNFGSDKNGFLSGTDIHPEYYVTDADP